MYILFTSRRANYIGHILLGTAFQKHIIEGNIEGTIEVKGRRPRRGKQLLDDRKETRGYWKLKEDVIDRIFFGELAL
jgi:hypothetical protein